MRADLASRWLSPLFKSLRCRQFDGLLHGLSTKTICSVDYPTVFAGLLLFHWIAYGSLRRELKSCCAWGRTVSQGKVGSC
jgi:hypothetical protein